MTIQIVNAPIYGSYNLNAGDISVNHEAADAFQRELIELYDKLTPIQQAKLLACVSDIADGKMQVEGVTI